MIDIHAVVTVGGGLRVYTDDLARPASAGPACPSPVRMSRSLLKSLRVVVPVVMQRSSPGQYRMVV
jgi:hypothetical protein